ncbi:MAG: hypothetical protein HY360_13260 [Verrucomicrobia bacterium]|nr:hypothetical protein [Verrucomicrobiota bacterium]
MTLESMGPGDAQAGIVSLSLPRESAHALRIVDVQNAFQPVGWWEKEKTPRRVLAFCMSENNLPETLHLEAGTPSLAGLPVSPWKLTARISREKLDYVAHKFANIEALRGVPANECTTVEYEILLEFGGRTMVLQAGSTGPKGGPYFWQNVQIDRLWRNAVVEAVRLGGVMYNEDTYLWTDWYVLLFANGVAQVTAHFVNTKLHIEGYDFQGLPLLRFAGEGLTARDAELPRDGLQFDLGLIRLNLRDAALLCSGAYPGRMQKIDADLLWYPVSRIFNPQPPEIPPTHWDAGFARTVRFQISFSEAPAAISRYRVPAWWYGHCGEPWSGGYLPVTGRFARLGALSSEWVQKEMVRGQFDGGSSGSGNDGYAGIGMMENFYHSGRADLFEDALAYCYYWADIAVDHRDFTIHQWIGGWPWKTCAYSKFRDLLCGYLETGDPYFRDAVENCAEAYWMWFRSNWPRCTIGRDAFEIGGWALLWRFLGTEHARERTLELTRMLRSVLDSRGMVGGQMGAGPHPGYLSALYMTGVCMLSLLEVAEAHSEASGLSPVERNRFIDDLRRLSEYFNRDDVGLFPSGWNEHRPNWVHSGYQIYQWSILGIGIYPKMARLLGMEGDEMVLLGLRRSCQGITGPFEDCVAKSRIGHNLVIPLIHDALMMGARVNMQGLELTPLAVPDQWPPKMTVHTPWGELSVECQWDGKQAQMRFESAGDFPVTINYHGKSFVTHSKAGIAAL